MRNLSVLILVSMCLFLNGQGGFRVRHYLPPAKTNITRDIFEISPGSYLACGITVETINGVNTNKIVIMGLGNLGEFQWSKKYGKKNLEYLNNGFISRAFFKNGNFVYLACGVRDSNNKQIGALIKFDLNGDTLWQRIYRDTAEDVIPQMVTTSVDGGFLITGFFQNWTNNTNPCLLIKTDANGNEIWRKRINKTGHNVSDGKAILQDSTTKKIIIVGYQYIGSPSSFSLNDNVLILDSVGTKLAQKNYSGFGGHLLDLIQTQDKKIVAVGTALKSQIISGNNAERGFIVKFDFNATGAPAIWMNTNFDLPSTGNGFRSIRELPNGDLVVGGYIDSTSALPRNILSRIVKFNSNGTIKSKKYYDYKINAITSDNNQVLNCVNLTSDGGWVAGIYQTNFPSPNPLFYVKYDSTGCDSTIAYCLNPVGLSNLYKISGYSFDIFPNPSNGFVNFKIEAPADNNFTVKVSEVSGKEMEQFKLEASKVVQLSTERYSPGIYFVSIFLDGKSVETKKLVIVK